MDIISFAVVISVCVLMIVFSLFKSSLTVPFIKIKGKSIVLESYCVIILLAPAILLLLKAVSFKDIFLALSANNSVNPLKILVLFISMCFLSVALDKSGFFEFCAVKILSKAKGRQFKLFIIFYAIISLLTIFTSNDIIILAFTPFVHYYAKNAKINAVPYMTALFVAANSWSLVLVIGNPTNIYIAAATGIAFIDYLKVMIIPTIVIGVFSFTLLFLIFYKQLKKPIEIAEVQTPKLKDKTVAALSLTALSISVILLSISSYINLEMWHISLVIALTLLAAILTVNIIRFNKAKHLPQEDLNENKNIDEGDSKVKITQVLKGLPYSVIPFLLAMFTAILALENTGVITYFAEKLVNLTNNVFLTSISFGFLTAFGSNIINNIPMSVLISSIISQNVMLSAPNSALYAAIYSSIIGSNLGAFLTPTGALAGILFMKINKEKNTGFSFKCFIKYCCPIGILTILASTLIIIPFV